MAYQASCQAFLNTSNPRNSTLCLLNSSASLIASCLLTPLLKIAKYLSPSNLLSHAGIRTTYALTARSGYNQLLTLTSTTIL